jgi:isoleucyl-tRNA synthetase
MYFARSSWFLTTTVIKDLLVSENQKIEWYPENVKDGRFGNFLDNNVDWAISRNRYWGTPLPIWVCENAGCGAVEVIGSVAELREKSLEAVPDDVELHRPGIDTFTFKCRECGHVMRRVPEVADTWFDSGSMPVAQWHYPFEFKEHFQEWYPSDFISEAQDQTRGWFYTLHAVAGLLHTAAQKFPDDPDLAPFRDVGLCFRRCICLGLILDDEGLKMSKSKGGYVEPEVILNDQGADALRWHFFSNVDPWVPVRFTPESVREAQRRFLLTLRNIYQFFTIYANIDGYDPAGIDSGPGNLSRLDKWIMSRLHRTIGEVREAMDRYDVLKSAEALDLFVDQLSNWYVRRSRERFWRSVKDPDKWAAYETLYTCLVELAKLLAPFTPFVTEEIYLNLVVGHLAGAKQSIHIERYPEVDHRWLDADLEAEVALAIEIAGLGRSARKAANLRVRQPLSEVIVVSADKKDRQHALHQKDVILDELNIKDMQFAEDQAEFVEFKVTPDFSKLGPRLGAKMPAVKKAFQEADHKRLRDDLVSGGTCALTVDGETFTFTDDEVQVAMESRKGYAAATGAHIAVVLSTELTPELEAEGIAREVVHHLQGLRKTADLDYQAKIDATVVSSDKSVMDALRQHRDYIVRETLSQELYTSKDTGAPSEHEMDAKINGTPVKIGIRVLDKRDITQYSGR